jgi:uracil-DNA glycosylase
MSAVSPKNKRKLEEEETNEENLTPATKAKRTRAKKVKNVTKKKATESSTTPKCTDSPKTVVALKPIENNLKQSKLSFFKVPKDNGNWVIEDFLHDKEWKTLLQDQFEMDYFKEINEFIKPGYKKDNVRPPKELVFNALNSTKLKDIKVVIIGQDPYHDDDQAHGLAFSVPRGMKIPPSLRNIFIELKNDIPSFEKDEMLGGSLQKWTKEGVFLLNAFLTVEAHKAGSHSKCGWDKFTDKVISLISEHNDGCAFLLWGEFAKKKELLIDQERHKVIMCGHPSPFSVTKFFNKKCFSGANDFLKSINKPEVNWSFK